MGELALSFEVNCDLIVGFGKSADNPFRKDSVIDLESSCDNERQYHAKRPKKKSLIYLIRKYVRTQIDIKSQLFSFRPPSYRHLTSSHQRSLTARQWVQH